MARRKKEREHNDRRGYKHLRRRSQIISTAPLIAVVCDDTKTAPAYFKHIKQTCGRSLRLDVIPAPSDGMGPGSIKAYADVLAERFDLIKTDQEQTAIFVLVDVEGGQEREMEAEACQRERTDSRITVLLSKPCYEVWTLLHLEDTGRHFPNCDAVISRVQRKWKQRFNEDFKKTSADYAKLIPLLGEAVLRARQHHQANDPSYTMVYQILDKIREFAPDTPL